MGSRQRADDDHRIARKHRRQGCSGDAVRGVAVDIEAPVDPAFGARYRRVANPPPAGHVHFSMATAASAAVSAITCIAPRTSPVCPPSVRWARTATSSVAIATATPDAEGCPNANGGQGDGERQHRRGYHLRPARGAGTGRQAIVAGRTLPAHRHRQHGAGCRPGGDHRRNRQIWRRQATENRGANADAEDNGQSAEGADAAVAHHRQSSFRGSQGAEPVGEVSKTVLVQAAGEDGGGGEPNQRAGEWMQAQLESGKKRQSGDKADRGADQRKKRACPPQRFSVGRICRGDLLICQARRRPRPHRQPGQEAHGGAQILPIAIDRSGNIDHVGMFEGCPQGVLSGRRAIALSRLGYRRTSGESKRGLI